MPPPPSVSRKEMAQILRASLDGNGEYLNALERSCVEAAAVELEKCCGTCSYFTDRPCVSDDYLVCDKWGFGVPADGSGFCHRHTLKGSQA